QRRERLLAELLLRRREIAERERRRDRGLARAAEPRDERRLRLLGAAAPDGARDRGARIEARLRGPGLVVGSACERERARDERRPRVLLVAFAEEAEPVRAPRHDVGILVRERSQEPRASGLAADARQRTRRRAPHEDIAALLIGRADLVGRALV